MSDVAPSPIKAGGQQASQKQVILVAVLGVVLLLVLVFMVLKPFGGDDSTPSVDNSAVTVPADSGTTGSTDSGSVTNTPAGGESATETTVPAPPRGRNPFDPPR
jgi:hypothetical protein